MEGGEGQSMHILPYTHAHAAAPRVEIFPNETRVPDEESVTFTCLVLAEPDAEVTFLFNGASIASEGRRTITFAPGVEYYLTEYTLEVVELVLADAGEYVCSAVNGRGSNFDSATLEVLG